MLHLSRYVGFFKWLLIFGPPTHTEISWLKLLWDWSLSLTSRQFSQMSDKCFVQGHINMAESCNQENIPRLKQLMPLRHLAESSHIMNWKKLSLLHVGPQLNEWMMMLAFDLALTELSDHYCPPLPLTEVLLKTWPCYDPCSSCTPTDNCSSFYFPLRSPNFMLFV